VEAVAVEEAVEAGADGGGSEGGAMMSKTMLRRSLRVSIVDIRLLNSVAGMSSVAHFWEMSSMTAEINESWKRTEL